MYSCQFPQQALGCPATGLIRWWPPHILYPTLGVFLPAAQPSHPLDFRGFPSGLLTNFGPANCNVDIFIENLQGMRNMRPVFQIIAEPPLMHEVHLPVEYEARHRHR